jgi:hypothetical protein
MVGSVGLEALGGELQGPAVLGDGPDDVIGGPAGDLSLNFEGDGDSGADDAGEVGDDFLGDASGIAAESGGVEGDGAVEPSGPCDLGFGHDRRRGARHGDESRSRPVPVVVDPPPPMTWGPGPPTMSTLAASASSWARAWAPLTSRPGESEATRETCWPPRRPR